MSIEQRFILTSVIAALVVFSCGGLFVYWITPTPEPVIQDVIVEVPVLINNTEYIYNNFSVAFHDFLITDLNESTYDYYWRLLYGNGTIERLPYFHNDSFIYAFQLSVYSVNRTDFRSVFPLVRFDHASSGFEEHPNITIDRIAVLSYDYYDAGIWGIAESYNVYNTSYNAFSILTAGNILYGRFGRCSDLDDIQSLYQLSYWSVHILKEV